MKILEKDNLTTLTWNISSTLCFAVSSFSSSFVKLFILKEIQRASQNQEATTEVNRPTDIFTYNQ